MQVMCFIGMEEAILLYNPNAGEEEDKRTALISQITRAGLKCTHVLIDENWLEHSEVTDLIVVAGGDGTVRKVAIALLARKLQEKRVPLALLPMGTANNVATTLQIEGTVSQQVRKWKQADIRAIDVGWMSHSAGEGLFLEGAGFGVFPRLIKVMDKKKLNAVGSAAEELELAMTVLHGIIQEYKAKYCKITADDVCIEGKFLLVEVMNMQSIGPNLRLAPEADPADGKLEVVYVLEEDRAKLAACILDRLRGEETTIPCQRIKASRIQLQWDGRLAHADDELIRPKKKKGLYIEVRPGVLDILA